MRYYANVEALSTHRYVHTNIYDKCIRKIFLLDICVISAQKEQNFRLLLFDFFYSRAVPEIQGGNLRGVRVQHV